MSAKGNDMKEKWQFFIRLYGFRVFFEDNDRIGYWVKPLSWYVPLPFNFSIAFGWTKGCSGKMIAYYPK